MAISVRKTEHAGAKNGGGGYWGLRVEAKSGSKKARRINDRKAADEDWGEIPTLGNAPVDGAG